MIKKSINKVKNGNDLTGKECYLTMKEIIEGKATDSQISSFLTALSMKGEKTDEISAAAKLMREKAVSIETPSSAVDLCGTGGDGFDTFNISTISSFVVAGAGVPVTKHGNRSVSSSSGSADLMEELGVKIDLEPIKVEQCIEEIGIGFMFAPLFHKAMKHAIKPRKEISIRTIFNLLGPLTNPGEVDYQLLGVYDERLTEIFGEVLKNLGLNHALVVHGSGLDELTVTGQNTVTELSDGKLFTYTFQPEEYGFKESSLKEIKAGNVKENAEIAYSILNGEKSTKLNMILLNSGAALYAADQVSSIEDGIDLAKKTIESGKALQKLNSLIDFTQIEGDNDEYR